MSGQCPPPATPDMAPSCKPQGEECAAANECCDGNCGETATRGIACCAPHQAGCSQPGDCCDVQYYRTDLACTNNVCCNPADWNTDCVVDADCCSPATCIHNRCLVPPQAACSGDSQCGAPNISRYCQNGACCIGFTPGVHDYTKQNGNCAADADCCPGLNLICDKNPGSGVGLCCVPNQSPCTEDADCCDIQWGLSPICVSGICCHSKGMGCATNTDCCAGLTCKSGQCN